MHLLSESAFSFTLSTQEFVTQGERIKVIVTDVEDNEGFDVYATARKLPYLENWEAGTGGWTSKRGDADPVVLEIDLENPTNSYAQKVTIPEAGGHYYSPLIAIEQEKTYCLESSINWVGGGWPFFGATFHQSDLSGAGYYWLMGQSGYQTNYGDVVTPVLDVLGWRHYQKEFVAPANSAYLRIFNELWSLGGKGGATLGYFDNIALYEGSCRQRQEIMVTTGLAGVGNADMSFELKKPGDTGFGPAYGISPHAVWMVPTNGNWIGPENGNVDVPLGVYQYRYNFQLDEVSFPEIRGTWAGDDTVVIKLNGNVIVNSPASVYDNFNLQHPFSNSKVEFFKQGVNELLFEIGNNHSASGLYFDAVISH